MDGEFEKREIRRFKEIRKNWNWILFKTVTALHSSATQFSLQIELGARGEDLRLARQLLVQIENL